jgi:hypothetical protein
MTVGEECVRPISSNNQRRARSSEVVSARARYSTSILERDIIYCFLLYQEIRVPRKETKANSRATVCRIPNPISIKISTEVKGGVSKAKTMKHSTLDTAKNVNHCSIVGRVRSKQELTHQMDRMSNIKASYSEID